MSLSSQFFFLFTGASTASAGQVFSNSLSFSHFILRVPFFFFCFQCRLNYFLLFSSVYLRWHLDVLGSLNSRLHMVW